MIEPSYELAGEQARSRMEQLGYVRGLKEKAESLGFKIIKHELFGVDSNPLNPAAVLIIKKNATLKEEKINNALCCPYTYCDMDIIGNAYFCKESMLSYPIINGVACLTRENAVIASKMLACTNLNQK